jgi:hypothetical protein
MFDLPLFCQYGIGSPGFGGWRELAANGLVTDAYLAGETSSFPLLYDWRVLPGRPPVAAEYAEIDTAVAKLGASPAVRDRLEALATASHSLALFLEYIPFPLRDWLREDPIRKAKTLERQMVDNAVFLRHHDLLHMDGHFGNMRTDGTNVYLADFGLATSPRYELSQAEREFVARNATHDAAYAVMQLVNWVVTALCGIPVPARGGPIARNEYVRRCASGDMPADVPPTVAAILARHAPAAETMNRFYWKLFGGELDTDYPASEIDRTLFLKPTGRP